MDITLSQDSIIQIIGWMATVVIAIIGLFGVIIGILHKEMIKRLDNIDGDLKPLVTQIAVHSEKIKDIEVKQDKFMEKVENHDVRIQVLEKRVTPAA